jgi:cytosine/creatinine deaminase
LCQAPNQLDRRLAQAPLHMDSFLESAIAEAKQGLAEGGIPIGSVLVDDGKIIGRGHNQRVQRGSVIHHGEMNCLENAGRQGAEVYRRCTLYTTLSPCPMCTGAVLLYGITRVVIGENVTFRGAEDSLRAAGVDVRVVQDPECIRMMREFIEKNPGLWNEDIGR